MQGFCLHLMDNIKESMCECKWKWSRVQLFATPGFSIHWIFQARSCTESKTHINQDCASLRGPFISLICQICCFSMPFSPLLWTTPYILQKTCYINIEEIITTLSCLRMRKMSTQLSTLNLLRRTQSFKSVVLVYKGLGCSSRPTSHLYRNCFISISKRKQLSLAGITKSTFLLFFTIIIIELVKKFIQF